MDGWIFAAALLVGILGFEFVAFRYFSDVSLDALVGSSDPTATGTTGATAGRAGAVTGDDPARECHNCGATNGDADTFRYCRYCLVRIR